MSTLPLTTVPLPPGGVDAALALIPAAAGVGQILAEGGQSLVIGRPSNLRRWAAGHLGRARPAKAVAGKLPPRPRPTSPRSPSPSHAWTTTSPFGQRLAYERLMARSVPLSKRRDLKRPAYLRLQPQNGYPHLVIESAADGPVYGPFRDRRAAARARDAVYKHFRIRPCDFDFKPAPALPDGLAVDVARALDGAAEMAEIPAWIRRAGGRSLIVERGKAGLELYPVAGGGVIEEAMVAVAPEALEPAIAGLAWTGPAEPRDDTPWLNAWRHGKRTGVEVPMAADEPAAAVASRIRAVVG